MAVTPGAASIYFIHSDQINTPRLITDAAKNPVWTWDSDPFGVTVPNEKPSGGAAFTYNPRFAGQYFDRETNLHYNYFRDYDPATGRYVESDPIGLGGGINTYAYVGGNPISLTDPSGLDNPGMGSFGAYYAWTPWQPTADPGLTTIVPEAAFIPLLRLPGVLDFLNKQAKRNEPKSCPGADRQFGKKYGEHKNPDKPGYRNHEEYRNRADEIYNDSNATRTTYADDAAKYRGETHIQSGNDLLRLDPSGSFRNLYPIGP